MRARLLPILLAAIAALACEGPQWDAVGDEAWDGRWQNLAPVPNPRTDAPPQPSRGHPYAVSLTADGLRALVALRGSELEPGSEVVVVDVPGRRVVARLGVGARPVAVGIRPQGDFAVVLCQLSPYAAVIDLDVMEVTGRIRLGTYAERLTFSPDGGRMFVTNRGTDRLERWELTSDAEGLRATLVDGVEAGVNPGAVVLLPERGKLYVADAGGLGVRVHDAETLALAAVVPLNAPIFDLAVMGPWVVAATLNDTNGLPCPDDADYPGAEGDGIFEHITDTTCSRGFADIQNEIAFIDPEHDLVAARFTSDSAEVSEADREGDHDVERMRVVGALPHSIAVVDDTRAFITMGASFEVVEMTLGAATPPSPPTMEMLRSFPTGFAPRGVAVAPGGRTVVVANMLGESVTIVDVATGAATSLLVGPDAPTFPATSAEIGELFFNAALYSTDGDQSCAHCHPDADSDGKTWGVGVVRAFGRRATMVVKNLHDTRPLLIEGIFDENDFTLEMEAMAFRPDFHDSSYALQVQRRNAYFREVSVRLMGRDLGFDEIAAHLADYLLIEPRLLPSPFRNDSPEAERGRALYFRADVACATCHPSPSFASPELFEGVTTMARFDRPRRDLDPDVSVKYIENARDGFFNSNSLRGAWDRRGAFLHDGRARTLRETLLTPGHECLRDGERGFNESDGRVDTNGGISHLSCDQIDDLVAFLVSID